MWSYTRHQLLVLLAAVAVGGAGVAVARWRAAHPALAERIERFDHSPPQAATGDLSRARQPAGAPHDPGGLSPLDRPRPPRSDGQPAGVSDARPDRRPAWGGPQARSDGRGAAEWPGAGPVAAGGTRARPFKLRPDDVARSAPVDLNRATAAELERLPGVGPQLAARIVEARAAGPFHSPDDLRRVQGLGANRLDRLRPFVVAAP